MGNNHHHNKNHPTTKITTLTKITTTVKITSSTKITTTTKRHHHHHHHHHHQQQRCEPEFAGVLLRGLDLANKVHATKLSSASVKTWGIGQFFNRTHHRTSFLYFIVPFARYCNGTSALVEVIMRFCLRSYLHFT